MRSKDLWKQWDGWRRGFRWVDLSHEVSPQTPKWSGFPPMGVEPLFQYSDGFLVQQFQIVSQYGTHIDAPSHFVKGQRGLDQIRPEEMVLLLCVLDFSKEAAENPDFTVQLSHIGAWEKEYGRIPRGAFVALRTDWWKREDMDNCDELGIKHFPGWSMEVLQFLVESRHVTAIGHETSDTDAGVDAATLGFPCEYYILEQGKYQIELMKNLDQVPPVGALLFCGFPKVKDGAGFTARCIALCPEKKQ